MYIMCLIIFEEKAEIQDQYPLSLNRDRDRLQKYWAIVTRRDETPLSQTTKEGKFLFFYNNRQQLLLVLNSMCSIGN